MSRPLHPLIFFRLGVLGPLTSRGELKRGEVKMIVRELASKTYNIPDSRRVHISEQTILRWYYDWKRSGIDGLAPSVRCDKGKTLLQQSVQNELLRYKKDNPSRSINTLIELLEMQGVVGKGTLSRATVHRFLKSHKLSVRILDDRHTIERRAFVAEHAGDLWQGDVLHGPSVQTPKGMKKTYLVSLMDDASRLITYSAFCLGETALDVEGVLKQAILKRGIPYKLMLDNGAAYRCGSLQKICAMLNIRLIYCRPYEPEGKGKLERFHRTFRERFLSEINMEKIAGLDELNARLWAWLEQVYHRRPHEGLKNNQTPIERWRDDLIHVRPLGTKAHQIDDIFYHRIKRTVKKDGTLTWEGMKFEVAYQYSGETVELIIDPHANKALRIESLSGDDLGLVTPLDTTANLHRKRQRPHHVSTPVLKQAENMVELAHQQYNNLYSLSYTTTLLSDEEK